MSWGVAKWLAAWEAGWWLWRKHQRASFYDLALAEARRLGRKLVVVGAPEGGVTSSPCGDITVDILPTSRCPGYLQADITKRIPLADDSVVVFVSYVLEYVADEKAALRELQRISGGHLYIVRVQPWTLTAYFYPGARRTIGPGNYTLGEPT